MLNAGETANSARLFVLKLNVEFFKDSTFDLIDNDIYKQ